MADLDNPARLSALDVVALGVDADAVLDACVEEAARLAEAPIALVTLVMRHIQLLRAHHGLPSELAVGCATSRENSFCQVVVRDEAALLVEDAALDPRVPQELVTRYGIRAYAGVPVRVRNQLIGTLCVIDVVPRRFDPSVVSMLESLGVVVGARLAALKRPAAQERLAPPDDAPAPSTERMRGVCRSARLLVRALEAIRPVVARLQAIEEEPSFPEEPALRQDLREAAACCKDLSAAARDLSLDIARLAQETPAGTFAQVVIDARAIERELSEIRPLIRLAEAGLEGRLEPGAVTRAAWVTRDALGFHAAALAAAQRLEASIDALVRTGSNTTILGVED
jgi:hypothetical protein